MLNITNTGVQTNTIDTEWSKKPIPNKKAKTPINIGFRDQVYGPPVTSSRGGLNGTGVPLAFKNQTTHQIHKANPGNKKTIPIIVPDIPENNSGKPKALSMYRPPKISNTSRPINTTNPTGVSSARRRLELVAIE